MTDTQQKAAAKAFSQYWDGKGYEKGESQPFWLSLLRDVFGVSEPEEFIRFEDRLPEKAGLARISRKLHYVFDTGCGGIRPRARFLGKKGSFEPS